MAKKQHRRNYKTEYRRRIARGLAQGLSKSQARGHRRANEKSSAREKAKQALEDHKLQLGLRILRREGSIAKAAKEAQLSPERLRRYAVENGIATKRGRKWIIKKVLPRRVMIFTAGTERIITVDTFKAASLVGKHMSAVGSFLRTNDKAYLRPFANASVKDKAGKSYLLESRPNVLYRLAHAGGNSFEQVYRIIV